MATEFRRYVDGTSSSSTTTASVDLSGCNEFEFALVVIAHIANEAASSVPSGWTLVDYHAYAATGARTSVYYKSLQAADLTTASWTFATAAGTFVKAAVYGAVDTSTPIDGSTKGTPSETSARTCSFGSLSTGEAMVVAIASAFKTSSINWDVSSWSGWAERVDAYAAFHTILIADSDASHGGGSVAPSAATEYISDGSTCRGGFLIALDEGIDAKSLGTCAASVSVAPAHPWLGIMPECAAVVSVCDANPTLEKGRAAPTMSAAVVIRVAPRYPTLGKDGSPLPANDGTGWTVPDATPPDILSMRVKIGTQRIPNARIAAFTMGLSDRGGYDSATLTVKLKRANEFAFGWHSTLVVTYKDTQLFRGRLEETSEDVGEDLTRTMVFTGPIVKLDDHQAFRRVYVDSDLDNWNTDQGPQTYSNVMEVGAT